VAHRAAAELGRLIDTVSLVPAPPELTRRLLAELGAAKDFVHDGRPPGARFTLAGFVRDVGAASGDLGSKAAFWLTAPEGPAAPLDRRRLPLHPGAEPACSTAQCTRRRESSSQILRGPALL
jgi:hypothetical protein